jgi:hypothetical protein
MGDLKLKALPTGVVLDIDPVFAGGVFAGGVPVVLPHDMDAF